jgi:hypothetical protein
LPAFGGFHGATHKRLFRRSIHRHLLAHGFENLLES